ncbi:MAG: 23S rRNA (pseudouridine(1915)-N(3))-methyltransferase RlmH [Gemmatimonadota bacterium]
MTIWILVVGKAKGILEPAIREFESRARRYWKLEVTEVEAGAGGGPQDPARVREVEARRIRDRLPTRAEIWVLTREGKGMSSQDLARELGDRALAGSPGVAFVIGGAFGVDPEIAGRADRALSLSRMTLPHAAARLILAEQLYRAGTILRGEPYHKGGE